MNNSVILVNKPIGLTPLEAVRLLQTKNPALQGKIAYAGRLDPMAHGLLVLLTGLECKKREFYQRLPKTYRVTILFGFSTDSYDALGKITATHTGEVTLPTTIDIQISSLQGTYRQQYPPYSSARVLGKPLFYYARNNLLETVTIPEKEIEIQSVILKESKFFSCDELLGLITHNTSKVFGDFRQKEIVSEWRKALSASSHNFPAITLEISSSQGAYMRSLAHALGEKIGIPAFALDIQRLRVGDYRLEDAIALGEYELDSNTSLD